MSKNYLKFLIITASIVSAAMLSGLSVTGLWKNSSEYWPPIGGYQYYRDSNDYLYEKSAVQIDALEIDLRFLDSGRHITIYDDGVCQIKIYDIRFTRITDDDGKLLDCYYTIGLGSFGKVTKNYGRIICGELTPPDILFPQIGYQIGGEGFNKKSTGFSISHSAVYLTFTISGGLQGEKAQELYAMDKITLQFADFYVNEWIRK